jgi:hypothetical protein
VEEVDLDVM